jgi:hypothetical protein
MPAGSQSLLWTTSHLPSDFLVLISQNEWPPTACTVQELFHRRAPSAQRELYGSASSAVKGSAAAFDEWRIEAISQMPAASVLLATHLTVFR